MRGFSVNDVLVSQDGSDEEALARGNFGMLSQLSLLSIQVAKVVDSMNISRISHDAKPPVNSGWRSAALRCLSSRYESVSLR